jgi:hypothetical protein
MNFRMDLGGKLMGHSYPCKDCIVMTMCTKLCDKLRVPGHHNTHNNNVVAKLLIENRRCIDCGHTDAVKLYVKGIMCINCRSVYFVVTHRDPPSVRRYYKSVENTYNYEVEITFSEYIDMYL